MITRLSGLSFHQEAWGLRLLFLPLTYTMTFLGRFYTHAQKIFFDGYKFALFLPLYK